MGQLLSLETTTYQTIQSYASCSRRQATTVYRAPAFQTESAPNVSDQGLGTTSHVQVTVVTLASGR